MLVKPARAESVPRVELRCDREMGEPVELDRLPVSLRRVGRYYVKVGCHLLELSLANRVRAFLRLFLKQFLISLAEYHDGVAVDKHRLELVFFGDRVYIVHEVEIVDRLMYFSLVFRVTFGEHVLTAAGVPRASLFHELGEHARSVAFHPFFRHARKDLVPHGLASPERDDDLFLIL